MSYVNWQDPGTREIRSTDISGLQEIVSKLERSVGMETVSETNIPLTEVYISENDRWRIFQAPEGKRNWVSEPAPVIKRDGVPIDIGFVIDYGAGAIILATNDTEEHTYTADATYIKSLQTSLNEELATHLADYDTFKQDIKGYIGYTENDIVGVEADFVNNKFTRLAGAVNKKPGADFDSIKAFGGRKRCILTDDGVVLAYYGEPGYVETGKLTQVITKNSVTYPVGTPVQVMVEQPKFYYKVVPLQLEPITDGIGYHLRKARYYVSDTPKVGFKVHPAFVRNGVEVDKIYLSAYEGSIYDESAGTYLLNDEQVADFNADKLSSIANAKPASGLTQNLTRANTRKLANNRGAGWQLSDVLSASVTQMLFIIEYASFNTQANIGLGVVSKPSGQGNESELTGATTNLGNASGMAVGTNGLVSISYRGEENFWGNIWKWIDGLNVYIDPDTRKTDAYWAAENFADDTGSAP